HALVKHEAVSQAVVLARENESAEKELVAYIVSNIEQNASDLRTYLKQSLPEYMLPAYFVQLEVIPLTANGKIDKKALPNPEGAGLSSGVAYVAPRNELEEKLVKIWEEVLKRENIGINDDFFALGGHSLKAVRLSNEYQKELGVKLTLREVFVHTSIASQAELIASSKREEFVPIEKSILQASYPISNAQRRVWVLSQFEGGSTAYNMPGSLYLKEGIEIENFKRAIETTIDRHEILRTVFREDESGEIRQWVLEKGDLNFSIDYQDFRKEADKQEKAEAYIAADSYRVFDLAKGPLLRAALLQVEEGEYWFYFNIHHIISDGWSMEILTKDIFKYYEAYRAGKEPDLKELRIQYKDYSAWQLAQLDQESFKAHREYWLDNLSGELPLLDLPGVKQRPQVKSFNGHGLATYLDKATTAKLKGYVQENGGSLFMGLLASWNVLMYRYTAQQDIIIGTLVAGRDHADLEDQIGFYVNTLALKNEINPQESFDHFYQSVKEHTLKSYNHQMYPFDQLVEGLGLQRDTGRSPIFDISITYHNITENEDLRILDDTVINQVSDNGLLKVKNDIELHFGEVGDYIYFNLIYNVDVYEREMIERLMEHFKHLLNSILSCPEEKISKIDYVLVEEKHKLLFTFNDTVVSYPKDKTIVDLFEEQVAKTPDNIAVVFEDIEFTYKELSERSNQLAHYLRIHYNIQSDDLIVIQLERSEWMIVSILGILKAGGAYVPIDSEYPQERIDYIKEDTHYKVCLDEQELSKFKESRKSYSKALMMTTTKENHLAYVIYTSGSTGNPKGVMVEHASLANYLTWGQSEYSNASLPLNFGLFTSMSFDLTVTSIYLPLISGGVLTIFSNTSDVSSIIKEYFESEISCIKLTPAHISLLGQFELNSSKVQLAIVGGEKLEDSHVQILRSLNPSISIYNEYGPTESTVGCTIKEIGFEKESILIGCPIANTQIYILNEKEELQAIGVVGEICIGG
ncbi:condensation domain-containing protein, partial [Flavobacterium sp. UGB4466]|uniref:condensation domain-containing protein n=1 Tax=Flavobacterium sp. UGB4466 TaxID=2730889 RepID=UPI00192CAE29